MTDNKRKRGGQPKAFINGRPMSKHPLNDVFHLIKQRCYNPKSTSYKYYGARGIGMCEEWKQDFMAFYKWAINAGWEKGLTIDRYPDKNGDYSPTNCRIATMAQQVSNRRISIDRAEVIRRYNEVISKPNTERGSLAVCPYCGKEFIKTWKKRIFCSKNHLSAFYLTKKLWEQHQNL